MSTPSGINNVSTARPFFSGKSTNPQSFSITLPDLGKVQVRKNENGSYSGSAGDKSVVLKLVSFSSGKFSGKVEISHRKGETIEGYTIKTGKIEENSKFHHPRTIQIQTHAGVQGQSETFTRDPNDPTIYDSSTPRGKFTATVNLQAPPKGIVTQGNNCIVVESPKAPHSTDGFWAPSVRP